MPRPRSFRSAAAGGRAWRDWLSAWHTTRVIPRCRTITSRTSPSLRSQIRPWGSRGPRLLLLLVLRYGAADVGYFDLPRRADTGDTQQGDRNLPVGFLDRVRFAQVDVLC